MFKSQLNTYWKNLDIQFMPDAYGPEVTGNTQSRRVVTGNTQSRRVSGAPGPDEWQNDCMQSTFLPCFTLSRGHTSGPGAPETRLDCVFPVTSGPYASEKIKYLGLPSLQYRRMRSDLVETYKIINNIDKVDSNTVFLRNESCTRGHKHKIYKKNTQEPILGNTVFLNEWWIHGTN
jgi:hypothetical protein